MKRENVIGRAVLRASFGRSRAELAMVDAAHLDLRLPAAAGPQGTPAEPHQRTPELPLAERIARFERDTILDAVARHGGNWAAAARELGVHRSNLHHRARRLGLR